jgi:hypothetical protein
VRLLTAEILVSYYGRLLALDVWEAPDNAGSPDISQAKEYYNRCRFSQIGSPIASDAWQSNVFGKGGFIDAPVNEKIISATFLKIL